MHSVLVPLWDLRSFQLIGGTALNFNVSEDLLENNIVANINTYATWLACGRKAAASARSSGALRGRAPLMARAVVAWSRSRSYVSRARTPPTSRGGLPGPCQRALCSFSDCFAAAAPLSIARRDPGRHRLSFQLSTVAPSQPMRRVPTHLLITTLPNSFALNLQTCARHYR